MCKNIILRRQQYRLSEDLVFCASLAKRFVAAKLANMRTILMRYSRNERVEGLDPAVSSLQELAKQAGAADTFDQVMGFEGMGSKVYFSAFPKVIASPFVFNGRNRRPPLDPVNAMLGFAYALLENHVERSVSVVGLDPFCGFLHREHYGRQSLVFDLMEELRPVVADSVVINCCNRSMIHNELDFETIDGGVYLNETGRQKFFKAFNTRMRETIKPAPDAEAISYERVCLRQARLLAESVRQKSLNYKPFLIK